MWREFIRSLTSLGRFSDPASAEEIARLEQTLGVHLPEDLRTLLEESNGVSVGPVFPELNDIVLSLVWSTEEIREENAFFRSFEASHPGEFPPLTPLFFFASEPNGDLLAFQVSDGRLTEPSIIRMRHDDYGDRKVVAASLREYLTQFLQFTTERERDAV
ncbi:MAG: SMI1/KNR4 family protein [Armatimonadetes bacterium]|nr:SMI1/KNR4 family protein [Armatimonadota bacterium]